MNNRDKQVSNWENEYEKSQYDEFIAKPTITPEEAWKLSAKNFELWCKKHYYPKLVLHFKNHLSDFEKWQKQYNILDSDLINIGLSISLAPNRFPKSKKLYIIHAEAESFESDYIGYRIPKNGKNIFGEYVNRDIKKSFISYHDWCIKNSIEPNLLKVSTISAPFHPSIRVQLEGGFELLKMGGITKPSTVLAINDHGKRLEFVDLSMLNITGESYMGSSFQFECDYCFISKMRIENSKIALPRFRHCHIEDIFITNSNIQQFHFIDCFVNGEIYNSNIISTKIIGGNFRPIIKDTFISDVNIESQRKMKNNLSYAYKLLKNLYKNQGEDGSAKKYHYLELIDDMKKSKPLRKLALYISYLFWGFGYRPINIITISLFTIIVMALLYTFVFPNYFNLEAGNGFLSFSDFLYISLVSYTTLGFGDVNPYGIVRLLVGFESFFGAVCIGFLVASLARNKY